MALSIEDRAVLTWVPKFGDAERVVMEPLDGRTGEFLRKEAHWNGCRWRVRGSEPVRRVSIEASDRLLREVART